jgi:membrane-associated protein
LNRAEEFYRTYGGKAIILARFLPVIRTFAPILAGVGKMRYTTFLAYNVVGAVIWGIGMPLLGFYLGNAVPNIDHYLVPIILVIIFASIIPPAIHILKDKEHRKTISGFVKRK